MNRLLLFFSISTFIGCFNEIRGLKLPIDEIFSLYVETYNLDFSSKIHKNLTYEVFQDNLAFIAHTNSKNLSYSVGINKFTHYV